jgi:uncharacterized protein (DUF2236 family)
VGSGGDNDLGLFGPDSVTWRVHSEPIIALGGLRALYLQPAHPRAMAGVAQNSDFRTDPWGRLTRTSIYVATVVYGTTEQANRAGERLRGLHARMWATDPHSRERFRIDEPDLLRWVHVTEIDSFLTTARRAGVALTDDEADRYVHEQRRAAELVGLTADGVPGSVAEIEEYYREILPRLRMTREAAESLLFLSAPPMPRGLGYTPVRGAWLGLAALAIGLLPPWARKLYGLPALPTTDLTASLSARALRLTLRALPRNLFEGPIYKSAMARAARATPTAGDRSGPDSA